MSSILPFNQIKKGGQIIAGPEKFIYGSGEVIFAGEDSTSTTADGLIHHFRSASTPTANCDLKGDHRNLDTGYVDDEQPWPARASGLVLEQVPTRDGVAVEVAAFDGIISVEYDSETDQSSVSIQGSTE